MAILAGDADSRLAKAVVQRVIAALQRRSINNLPSEVVERPLLGDWATLVTATSFSYQVLSVRWLV